MNFFFQVYSDDVDTQATKVEMDFLHYTSDGYWDFPKEGDIQLIDTQYIFYGLTTPTSKSRKGYLFGQDDTKAPGIYKLIRNK